MKYLRMLMLPLALILVVSCEDDEAEAADCDALLTAFTDATAAYIADMTNNALCTANAAAYKAGLDAGCTGYTQADYDDLVAGCN